MIKTSRATLVYEALRRDILSGDFAPGERLAFTSLTPRYECSVGVLREALQRLAEQGLVDATPAFGFRVTAISPADLEELTTARQEIEVLALRYAIRGGDTAWEARLVAAHHILSQSVQYEDIDAARFTEAWAVAHNDFHVALLTGCANRRILASALGLRDAAELYWRWSAPHYDRERDIAHEHREILEATLAREEDHAADLLSRHISRTTDKLLGGVGQPTDEPDEQVIAG